MVVLDDQTCPVGMVWNLEHFFAQESWRLVYPMLERAGVDGEDFLLAMEQAAESARDLGTR